MTKKLLLKIVFNFITILSLIIINSCMQLPEFNNPVDPENTIYKLDSNADLLSQESQSYRAVVPLGQSTRFILGKSTNITSHSLIEFEITLADSIRQSLDNLSILDAYVRLYKDYEFGSTFNLFDYNVFEITTDWNENTFIADNFANLLFNNIDISSSRMSYNDIEYSFNINTDLARQWLYDEKNFNSQHNFGILLSPSVNSEKSIGFISKNVGGLKIPELGIVVVKPGEWIDTIKCFPNNDTHVNLGTVPNTPFGQIVLQSGLSASKLWFDISSIPKNATIISSELNLTLDPLNSQEGSVLNNTIDSYLMIDSSTLSYESSIKSLLNRSSNSFVGDISNIVQHWVNNTNQGLFITTHQSDATLDLLTLFGSNSVDINSKPRLIVNYILQ